MSTELGKAKIFNNYHFAAFTNEECLYYVTVTAHQLLNQADIQHYWNAAVITLQNVMKFCISFTIQHTHC